MYSVLLADDERWVRTSLRKTIEKTGLPFEVAREAADGMEAADWLREHAVDLVVADIRMPVMDGLAFAVQLKEGRRETPDVIIVSGHDDFHDAQQAIRSGVFDYLLKPVDIDVMRGCLQRWMDAKRSPSGPVEADESFLSPVEQVIRYVETEIPPHFSLKEAAEMAHHNPSYFSQVFKQQTNQNFVDFVADVKLRKAQRLLEQTSLRISEIADRLGFNDLAYFSNMFKRHVGQTPSQYRKDHALPPDKDRA